MTPLRNTILKSSKPSLFPCKLILALLLFSALFGLLLISCSNPLMEDSFSTDPYTNLNYLWEDLDKRYAYFEEKGIDWETQKTKYHDELVEKADDGITHMELFSTLAEMLKELRDGHVNLYGPVHTSYYNVRKYLVSGYDRQRMLYRYLDNDSPHLHDEISVSAGPGAGDHGIEAQYPYYGAQTPYQVFSLWKNDTTEPEGEETHTILYITYNSFMDSLGSIDNILYDIHIKHEDLDGYIIDLRSNGGGRLQNVHSLMGRIVREPVTAYYEMRKSLEELEEDNFPSPEKVIAYPLNNKKSSAYKENAEFFKEGLPIKFLTDRGCYSATNFFSTMLRSVHYASENGQLDTAVDIELVGNFTGGGSGIPIYSQLPNGWQYRFSSDKACIPKEYAENILNAEGNRVLLDDYLYIVDSDNESYAPDAPDSMIAETMIKPYGETDYLHTEDGVPPHRLISQKDADTADNRDTVFEYALSLFLQ